MKIYVIVNELKNICYVIANNIESAMKEYKKKYESLGNINPSFFYLLRGRCIC